MGDEQKQPNPHQAELTQVAQQVGVIDAANTISNIFGGGNVRCFGTTDFENHRLNDMIDMVETASPEHLENAGNALWEARDAISDAAKELRGHIDNVDWEGDSGQAFRDWGSDLVTYAVNLASFAEVMRHPDLGRGHGPRLRPYRHAATRHPLQHQPDAQRHSAARARLGQRGVHRGGQGREGPTGGDQPDESVVVLLHGVGGGVGGTGAAYVFAGYAGCGGA